MPRTAATRMTQIVERTVLFADLRGSTSMYETLGNADATAVVTQSVALLAPHRRRSTAARSSRRWATG